MAAALGNGDFTTCLDQQGRPEDEPPTEGLRSGDEEDEVAFWSHPLALHCATIALNEDDRVRALSVAFPSLEGDRPGDIDDQWKPFEDYATWLADDGTPQDVAMLRIASGLRGLWVAHADAGNWARGFTEVVVLADMRARDELPGFAEWVEENDLESDDIDLFAYRGDVLEKAGDETQSAYREHSLRARALYDVVR
jgi:hypothetical protein